MFAKTLVLAAVAAFLVSSAAGYQQEQTVSSLAQREAEWTAARGVGQRLAEAAGAAPSASHHLIAFSDDFATWLSPEEVERLHRSDDSHYVDLTDTAELEPRRMQPASFRADAEPKRKYPTTPSQGDLVELIAKNLDPSVLTHIIGNLEKFPTRYYTTDASVKASEWYRNEFATLARDRPDVHAELYSHPSWKQPSIVVTINGTEKPNEIVVVGAHIDSTSRNPTVRAPGADDDASGAANSFDVFRAMLLSGYKPKRTIEFHGWAAEEVGLRGSREVAKNYRSAGADVYAVYACEMSGWRGRSPAITIIHGERWVHPQLSDFLIKLVEEYTSIPYMLDRCGYACSDHASWTEAGYAAVIAAEAGPRGELNPYYHTDQDLLKHLDVDYSSHFSKLALSFAVELAEF